MSEREGRARVPVPPPSDDADRALEARVRQKMYAREPLSAEEKAYFLRVPGEKQP